MMKKKIYEHFFDVLQVIPRLSKYRACPRERERNSFYLHLSKMTGEMTPLFTPLTVGQNSLGPGSG